ncbi:hypothetical protein ACLIA0_08610 [Bacillaceae bacterium W0354]
MEEKLNLILSELVRIEQSMATKDELARIEKSMVTKDELTRIEKSMVTKDELTRIEKSMVTKDELARIEGSLAAEIARVEEAMTSELERVEGAMSSELTRVEGTMATELFRIKGEMATKTDINELKNEIQDMKLEQKLIKQAVFETNDNVKHLQETQDSMYEMVGSHEIDIRTIKRKFRKETKWEDLFKS